MAKSSFKSSAALKTSPSGKASVADALQSVLQETYSLYLVTHNYHWNVEGQNFYGLHKLFEEQYNELFLALDELAERIRALDVYALCDHYNNIFNTVAPLAELALKKKDRQGVALQMVENLLKLNLEVIDSAGNAKRIAESAGDDETVDMMVRRIQVHQKATWMLRSLSK